MKKVTSLLLLVGVAAFGLVACGDNVVPPDGGNVEGVTVTPSTLNIGVGGSGALTADVDGDPDNSVTWSSNAESVATVSSDGTVTGVSEGNAVVTATSTVDNAHSASAQINVTALENAEVSINSIRAIDNMGNETALDPNDVSGRIRVSANVSEGDRSVEAVQILFNGEVAATQTFASGDLADAEGIEMQGEVSVVTIDVNTAQAEGGLELDGTVHTGAFPNGDQTVTARLVLANGTNVDAEHGETLTFNNENVIHVTHMGDGNRAVSSNTPTTEYWGGTTVTFAATPVIYDGRGVGTVTITQSGGSAALTFADGPTVSEPFLYPVEPGDNGSVEDVPGPTNGHNVSFGSATDAEGIALPLNQVASVTDMHLDFAAPTAGGEVFIDGATVAASTWYSAGAFSVPGSSDAGVGVPASAASEFITVDVIDTGTSDTIPGAETVEGDLTEREIVYTGELVALADLLGNATDLTGTSITTANDFGADFGAPTFSDVAPNDATFVFNGDASDGSPTFANHVLFSSTDPALADETAGSGVNTGAVAAEVVNSTTADTANVTAAAAGVLDNANAPEYTLDVSTTSGTALGDGSYVITATSPDNAVLDPNVGEQVIEFILDTSAPSFGALNPAPASTATQATSVLQDIGGTVTDANVIDDATITVRATSLSGIGDHADGVSEPGEAGTSGNDICEPTDELLDVANGDLVTGNNRDISNDTDSIEFSETFEINDPFPGGTGTVKYCFFVSATDEALNNAGDPDGNSSSLNTESTIEWQN